MTFAAQVLTLYPEMFPGPLGHSLAGRALAERRWSLDAIQIRDFATDKHRSVDDTPAGGGAGMVLRADVLASAVDHALERSPHAPVIAMTPREDTIYLVSSRLHTIIVFGKRKTELQPCNTHFTRRSFRRPTYISITIIASR